MAGEGGIIWLSPDRCRLIKPIAHCEQLKRTKQPKLLKERDISEINFKTSVL